MNTTMESPLDSVPPPSPFSLAGIDFSSTPSTSAVGELGSICQEPFARRLIRNAVPELPRALGQLEEAAAQAGVASKAFTEMLTSLQGIFSQIPAFTRFASKFCEALALLYDIFVAWLKEIYLMIPTLIYRLVALFDLPSKLAQIATLRISLILRPSEPNQGQHAMHAQGAETMISSLSSTIGLLFLAREPSKDELRHVNDRLRFSQMMRQETKSYVDMILGLIQHLPDVIKQWAQFALPSKWWFELFQPGTQYHEWMTEVESLDNQDVKIRASYDVELQTKIRNLHQQGLQILKDCAIGPQFQKIFTLLRDRMRIIDELFETVDTSSMKKGSRQVPFCVYLEGRHGKGKSFVATVLPSILAQAPYDTPNMNYTRNVGVDHWDGYTGQFAVTYDDFACRKSSTANPGEFAELIAIVSNSVYPLPMASLEEKGEVFRSKVVIACSNFAFPAGIEMNHPAALYRRRHVMYNVDVKPEFCTPTGIVDSARTPLDNSHYEFRRYVDPSDSNHPQTGNPMTYQEFIQDVREEYRLHVLKEERSAMVARNMVQEAVNTMHGQGVLMDALNAFTQDLPLHMMVDAGVSGIIGYNVQKCPKWYRELKEICQEQDPDWYTALITGSKLIVTAVGSAWFLYSTYQSMQKIKKQNTVEAALGPTIRKIQNLIAEGHEVLPRKGEHMIRSALGGFRGLIPDEEFEAIVEKYLLKVDLLDNTVAEGAYGMAKTVAVPRPTVLRSEGTVGKIQKFKMRPPPMELPLKQSAHAEGANDENALTVAETAISPALVTVQSMARTMQGLMIKGRACVVPRHVFIDMEGEYVPDNSPIIIESAGVTFEDRYFKSKMVNVGSDLVIYQFNVTCRSWKDITHHFWKDSDLMSKPQFDAMLITLRGRYPHVIEFQAARLDYPVTVSFHPTIDGEPGVALSGGHIIHENEGFYYSVSTKNGDCGGVLMSADKMFPRKVCGIHVAGCEGKNGGAALFLSQEMINIALRQFEQQIAGAVPRGRYDHTLEGVTLQPQGSFTLFGRLTKRLFQSRKTKIRPSLIHGKIFEPVTAPSVLDPRDPRMDTPVSPLKKGIEKYGNKAVWLDADLVDRVSKHITQLFTSWESHMVPQVVSLDKAINGDPMYEFADGIVMDTSPGFPYNQREKVKPGKLDLFIGEPGAYIIQDAELAMLTEMRWQNALQGKRIPSLWIDCLKDERRSLDKIRAGKTRVFTIPPLDFTLCFRRLTLAFSTTFYKNALNFFSAVGVDPESYQWTILYNRHARVSREGFAGDYSGYDGNLSPQLMMECCEIINRWYDDDEVYQVARRVMFDEIIHTPQGCLNLVYMTHIGNPSGNPLTAIVNTIIDAMYMRYTWLVLAPRDMKSLAHYEENVVDTDYGDDIIVTVSEKARGFFNPDDISRVLNNVGMTFTAATKDQGAHWERLCDLTFLKRGFRKGELKRWLPTMNMDTIQELTNWIRQSDFVSEEEMTLDNCNNALRFMFFHGKNRFQLLYKQISEQLRAFGLASKLHDYAYYYEWFYEVSHKGIEPQVLQMHAQSNVVRDSVNAKGIISLSQRGGAEDDGSTAPIASNKSLAKQAIADPAWSLPDMSKRRVWVDTFQWSTGNVFQSVLASYEAPSEFLLSHMQTAAFERFLYWDGTMTLRIHVNGTRFHAGRLIAFFVPWVRKTKALDWHAKHMPAAWSVPNVQLDAASSNTGNLNVAFYNPKSKIVLNGPVNANTDYTGTFILQVLSPLTAAGSTPSIISVNVWVEFNNDQQFSVPAHSALTNLRTFNAEHQRQREVAAAASPREMHGQGNVFNTLNEYNQCDRVTTPMEMTGDNIGCGNKIPVSLMDKVARQFNPIENYQVGFQALASTVGSEHCRRLDLHTAPLNLCQPSMFGTMNDEMEFGEMLQRPTYAGSFTWNASDPIGTVLQSRWVGPMSTYYQNASQAQVAMVASTTQFTPPTLDYVAPFFAFWRGSMKLRFDIVATQMHTGRLFLALNYGTPPDANVALRDATSQYGVEIDVSNECRTFVFEIEQNVPTVWMNIPRGPRDVTTESTTDWFLKYFYGSWAMNVISVLVAPDNVVPNIEIFWSVAAGDDFEMYYPAQYNEALVPRFSLDALPSSEEIEEVHSKRRRMHAQGEVPRKIRRMHAQGEAEGVDAVPVPAPVETIQDSGIAIAPTGSGIQKPVGHFGRGSEVLHISQIIKRYVPFPISDYTLGALPQYILPGILGVSGITNDKMGFFRNFSGSGTTPPGASSYGFFMFVPVIPFGPGDTNNGTDPDGSRTPLDYFGLMFRFWRGGMRYKIIWDGVTDYKGNPLIWGTTGATFLPGTPITATGTPNYAAIALRYINALDSENGAYSVDLTTDSTTVAGLAVDATTARARYNDIEIPFTTNLNVLPTLNAFNGMQRATYPTKPGYVLFVGRFRYSGVTADEDALEAAGLGNYPKIFVAAGDDFRLGTYLGPPFVVPRNSYGFTTVANYTTNYETWLVSQPASTTSVTSVTTTSVAMSRKQSDGTSDEEGFVMTKSLKGALSSVIKQHKAMHAQGDTVSYASVEGSSGLPLSSLTRANHIGCMTTFGAFISVYVDPIVQRECADRFRIKTASAFYPAHILHMAWTDYSKESESLEKTLLDIYEVLATDFAITADYNVLDAFDHFRVTVRITTEAVGWRLYANEMTSFKLERGFGSRIWDAVRLSALTAILDKCHEMVLSDLEEQGYEIRKIPSNFSTGLTPADPLAGLQEKVKYASMHAQGDTSPKPKGFQEEMMPPTNDNIRRMIRIKREDVIRKRKTPTQAWNEFKQCIPAQDNEKDESTGPPHDKTFICEIKSTCANKHWKDVEGTGVAKSKKAARDIAYFDVINRVFTIYDRLIGADLEDDDEPEQEVTQTDERPTYYIGPETLGRGGFRTIPKDDEPKYVPPPMRQSFPTCTTPKPVKVAEKPEEINIDSKDDITAIMLLDDQAINRLMRLVNVVDLPEMIMAADSPLKIQLGFYGIEFRTSVERSFKTVNTGDPKRVDSLHIWTVTVGFTICDPISNLFDHHIVREQMSGKLTYASLETLLRAAFTSFFTRISGPGGFYSEKFRLSDIVAELDSAGPLTTQTIHPK